MMSSEKATKTRANSTYKTSHPSNVSSSISPSAPLPEPPRQIWNALAEQQRNWLLDLAALLPCTPESIRSTLAMDALSEDIISLLTSPLFYYDPLSGEYHLDGDMAPLLSQMAALALPQVQAKRLRIAGCGHALRDEVPDAAQCFYRAESWADLLALDLTRLLTEGAPTGHPRAFLIKIERRLPREVLLADPVGALRLAYALYAYGEDGAYDRLLASCAESAHDPRLRGEWLLVESFSHFPDLAAMATSLRKAASLLKEKSQVISAALPLFFGSITPWGFAHYEPGALTHEREQFGEWLTLYHSITGGGAGADALFDAEIHYNRGEHHAAGVAAGRAAALAELEGQDTLLIGSAIVLGQLAIRANDGRRFQQAQRMIDRGMEMHPRNAALTGLARDFARGILLQELRDITHIAPWIRGGSLWEIPQFLRWAALFLRGLCALDEGRFYEAIGQTDAALTAGAIWPTSLALMRLTAAIAHENLGEPDSTAEHLRLAIAFFFPDELHQPVACYCIHLPEAFVDASLDATHAEAIPHVKALRAAYLRGFQAMNDDLVGVLPSTLTSRELDIARLAARGLTNEKIAEALDVSVSTVRTHLRKVFIKLSITRRAELMSRLI